MIHKHKTELFYPERVSFTFVFHDSYEPPGSSVGVSGLGTVG
jgi:hypothetical protein